MFSWRFLLLTLLVLTFGCQRLEIESVTTDAQSSEPLTVAIAKQWFEANQLGTQANSRQGGNGNIRRQLKKETNWKDAYSLNTVVGAAVVVPLKWEQNLMARVNLTSNSTNKLPEDSRFGLDYLSYALIYKDKKNKETIELVTANPDADWAKKPNTAFSGVTIVEDWKGNFLRGHKYKEGNVVADVMMDDPAKKGGRLCDEVVA